MHSKNSAPKKKSDWEDGTARYFDTLSRQLSLEGDSFLLS
jgi:hypothetical protein